MNDTKPAKTQELASLAGQIAGIVVGLLLAIGVVLLAANILPRFNTEVDMMPLPAGNAAAEAE